MGQKGRKNIEVLAGNRQTSVLPDVEAVECGEQECEKTVGLPEKARKPTGLRLIKGWPMEGHGEQLSLIAENGRRNRKLQSCWFLQKMKQSIESESKSICIQYFVEKSAQNQVIR
jgi:hypothetical protein